jgi:Tol biopolymer transport system component
MTANPLRALAATILAALAAFVPGAAAAHNGLIAYVRSGGLYTAAADGSSPRLIARLPQGAAHPSWSPDGTRIVFSARMANSPRNCKGFGLWIVNADGTGLHRLSRACDQQPAWSPDGTQIAFTRRLKQIHSSTTADVDLALMLVNPDGSGAHRVTQTQATARTLEEPSTWRIDANPAWSPDGSTIAYASQTAETGFQITFVRRDGTPLGQLPAAEGTFDAAPSFSPDGRRIVFQRWSSADFLTVAPQVLVENRDGSAVTIVGSGGPGQPAEPTWSPDGTTIAWSTDGGIATAAPDGSAPALIPLPGGSEGFWPAWQPLP